MKKKCGKNYFKGPKMAAKDDATILTAPTVPEVKVKLFFFQSDGVNFCVVIYE